MLKADLVRSIFANSAVSFFFRFVGQKLMWRIAQVVKVSFLTFFGPMSPTKRPIDGKLITFCEDIVAFLWFFSFHSVNIPSWEKKYCEQIFSIVFFIKQKIGRPNE